MKKRTSKPLSFKLILLLLPLAVGISLLLLALFGRPRAQREDYRAIASRAYDCAFLSMYPTDAYAEEDFQRYLGLTAFRASYCIPSLPVMEQYMRRIARSGNTITTIYLGIRPDRADPRELLAMIEKYPSVLFEVILAYPSLEYWAGLSDSEYEQALSAYSAFLTDAAEFPHTQVFFPGRQEWLIANPGNYETLWTANEAISRTLLLECTISGEHFITPERAQSFSEELSALTRKARTSPDSYPDLSDRRLVFLGDSVIGNYTDSASIPGVVRGLSGAAVYNCGYGGNSAAESPEAPVSLPGIARALVSGDLSALPREAQVYQGVSAYLSDYPAGSSGEGLCVVIAYGLNDYFCGYPVSSREDPLDTTTYCGAVRTAVRALRDGFPQAQIILLTPSYCYYYQRGTEPHGDGNYVLEDYVDAVLDLSQELQVDVLDTHHAFGVENGNWERYLVSDQVHPNAFYRYLIGRALLPLIR